MEPSVNQDTDAKGIGGRATFEFVLSADAHPAALRVANCSQTTVAVAVVAAASVLAHRYTGRSEVLLGLNGASRREHLGDTVAAIAIELSGQMRFDAVLRRLVQAVRGTAAATILHRDPNAIAVLFQSQHQHLTFLPPKNACPRDADRVLRLSLDVSAPTLHGVVEYGRLWFDESLMRRLPSHLDQLLCLFAADSSLPIGAAEMVHVEGLASAAIGKVDRVMLPPTPVQRPVLSTDYEAPRNDVERAIARFWVDALRIERIGIRDHFLEAGGDSMAAMLVIAQVNEHFGLNLSTVLLLTDCSSIAELATLVQAEITGERSAVAVDPPNALAQLRE